MIQIKNENVIIPLTLWNELKRDNYFAEIIEVIEDSNEFEKAKKETSRYINFKSYDRKRRAKMKNV
ncbi:MAG: hypothetical protein ABIY50_07040 [Ignavibacteria bacterium]